MMIDLFIWLVNWLPAQLYLLSGLIALLIMMNLWKINNGELSGIDSETMGRMFILSILMWPYILLMWILSWPLFTWVFWLKNLSFKPGLIDITKPKA